MMHMWKLVAGAAVSFLMMALAVCSCSNDSKPEQTGMEDIDAVFLSGLARGEISTVFDLDKMEVLEKNYDPVNGVDGNWRESSLLGWEYPDYSSIMVMSGSVWRPIWLFHISAESSILYYPWKYYCKETGWTKAIRIAVAFEFDADNKKLRIDKSSYDIEKADTKSITISSTLVREVPDNGDGDLVPGLLKFVLHYSRDSKAPDVDSILFFDSEKDAKLAMVRMMREYFGDKIDLCDYAEEDDYADRIFENPVIDLAALEDDLLNDRDEWHSWSW